MQLYLNIPFNARLECIKNVVKDDLCEQTMIESWDEPKTVFMITAGVLCRRGQVLQFYVHAFYFASLKAFLITCF